MAYFKDFLILLIFFSPLGSNAQNIEYPNAEIGPKNGSLVIVGGGKLGDDIIHKFIELAGGPEAKIIFIPTAGGNAEYDDKAGEYLRSRGAKNVNVMHTIDREIADSKQFSEAIANRDGVWFTGGRQWRLVDAYGGTLSEEAFNKVLQNGGVIGGSSAGATIQGSYLARGDTQNNQIMMGDHEAGFGFLKNTAIDQHVLARNRQFDMFNILEKKPNLLGIGLDENTAIVVRGDSFEVIGSSYVLIYDNSFWSREGSELKKLPDENIFYFLRAGDQYDLKQRTKI